MTRTSIIGATVVGTSMFSHGRSPYVAWGVTAINPDVSDVYIEELKERNQYRTTKDKWADLKIVKDTIKVRFGSPYEFEIKKTENGVLIPNDLLDGSAGSLIPWIDNYVLHGDQVDGITKAYAIANIYDPFYLQKFNQTTSDFSFITITKAATNNKNLTAQQWVDTLLNGIRGPLNHVFAIEKTGDIGFVLLGRFPIRKYNVV